MDRDVPADHLGDGDRLPDGAAETEDQRRRDPRARIGEDDAADHLPARGAERERAFLEVARHAEEELAAHARDDRRDHDRQDEDCRQQPEDGRIAAEERDEPERPLQERLDVVGDDGAHDEDAPEPDDDARDGREHLDERPHRASEPAGRELGQEERDRDRERAGDQERPDRRHGGAEEERGRAEHLTRSRVPRLRGQEVQAEVVDRRQGLVGHLPGDEEEERDRGERGRKREAVEGYVSGPEAPAPPEIGGAGGLSGDRAQATTGPSSASSRSTRGRPSGSGRRGASVRTAGRS